MAGRTCELCEGMTEQANGVDDEAPLDSAWAVPTALATKIRSAPEGNQNILLSASTNRTCTTSEPVPSFSTIPTVPHTCKQEYYSRAQINNTVMGHTRHAMAIGSGRTENISDPQLTVLSQSGLTCKASRTRTLQPTTKWLNGA